MIRCSAIFIRRDEPPHHGGVTDHREMSLDFVAFRAPPVCSPPDTPREASLMYQFVERQNITHYVDRLKTEKDPTKRPMLERLLAEEPNRQATLT
jgi:hypothetical protein